MKREESIQRRSLRKTPAQKVKGKIKNFVAINEKSLGSHRGKASSLQVRPRLETFGMAGYTHPGRVFISVDSRAPFKIKLVNWLGRGASRRGARIRASGARTSVSCLNNKPRRSSPQCIGTAVRALGPAELFSL